MFLHDPSAAFRGTRRAFTLTELLVVVIVLGVLSAVAVPKFTRLLETRKTTEAEDVMGAIRTEQEKRCALGKNYAADLSLVAAAKGSDNSSHYSYSLGSQGVTAASGKGYSLKILSYKDGRVCCEGSYCQSLNKDYPLCASLTLPVDECAASSVPEPEADPCDANPNSCACAGYASAHACECRGICNACETNPDSCSCDTYAAAHPEECDANSCTNNPNQEKCCDGATQKWDGTKCVALTECDKNPNQCICEAYAAVHAEECDANSCTNNPHQEKCCAAQHKLWDGEKCVSRLECPDTCPKGSVRDEAVRYEYYASGKPCCRDLECAEVTDQNDPDFCQCYAWYPRKYPRGYGCVCNNYFATHKSECCMRRDESDDTCYKDCVKQVLAYEWNEDYTFGTDSKGNPWKFGECFSNINVYNNSGCDAYPPGTPCTPSDVGKHCAFECVNDDRDWLDSHRREHYVRWVKCSQEKVWKTMRCRNGW